MAITIDNAKMSQQFIPNGTNPITISFTGQSFKDNTQVMVRFEISQFPELNFSGKDFANASFTFNKESTEFHRNLTILNNLPDAHDHGFGLLILIASEIGSSIESPATISFRYA